MDMLIERAMSVGSPLDSQSAMYSGSAMGVLATDAGGDERDDAVSLGKMVERTPVGVRPRSRRPRTVDS